MSRNTQGDRDPLDLDSYTMGFRERSLESLDCSEENRCPVTAEAMELTGALIVRWSSLEALTAILAVGLSAPEEGPLEKMIHMSSLLKLLRRKLVQLDLHELVKQWRFISRFRPIVTHFRNIIAHAGPLYLLRNENVLIYRRANIPKREGAHIAYVGLSLEDVRRLNNILDTVVDMVMFQVNLLQHASVMTGETGPFDR